MSRSSFIHRRRSGSYKAEVLADSPIIYWRLDESSGSTVNDSSGNSNNGTYHPGTGTLTYAQVGALNSDPASTSVKFAGGTTAQLYLQSAQSTTWDLSSFTWELWLNPTAPASLETIGMVGPVSGTGIRWAAEINNIGNNIRIFANAAGQDFTTVATNAVWQHIVLTYSGGTWNCYKNGLFGSTISKTINAGITNQFVIVGQANNGDQYQGGLDEIALYSGVLSATRIAAHWNAAF